MIFKGRGTLETTGPQPIIPFGDTISLLAAKFVASKIMLQRLIEVKRTAQNIIINKDKYDEVSDATGIPWYVIGCIHYRECDLSFDCHLHNGDPLTAKTVHIPKGRPFVGSPPFTWLESAIDAIGMHKNASNPAWTPGLVLDWLERYNGLGYRNKNVPSPYIWSFTTEYKSGKYTSDGDYDPLAVDAQCGVAAIIKALGIFTS